jgi:hypothetical protein
MVLRALQNVVLVCCVVLLTSSVGPALAETFSNTTPIITPDPHAPAAAGYQAAAYPSTIEVGGLSGTITRVGITLKGFSHQNPSSVRVLLVGPSGGDGPLVALLDDPSAVPVSNIDLSFDDGGPELPTPPSTTPLASGTYRPFSTGLEACGTFGPSAPKENDGLCYHDPLGAFAGQSPNGTWSLYVYHSVSTLTDETGSIAGWCLDITTTASPGGVSCAGASGGGTPEGAGPAAEPGPQHDNDQTGGPVGPASVAPSGSCAWRAARSLLGDPNVRVLVTDPTNAAILYAGTDLGVFKTTNSAATWTPSSTGLGDASGTASHTKVQALALDPSSPSTLYAGTADRGVFKTTDGGQTWAAINAGLTEVDAIGRTDTYVDALAVDPSAPSILYAGSTSGGLWKSVDGGVHWALAKNGLNAGGIAALGVGQSGDVYAGANTGLFKSIDGGGLWFQPGESPGDLQGVNALALRGRLPSGVVAGTLGGLFVGFNNGLQWVKSTNGLPATAIGSIAIDPTRPSLYAVVISQGLFMSDDGQSWHSITGNLPGSVSVVAVAIDGTVYAGTWDQGSFKIADPTSCG